MLNISDWEKWMKLILGFDNVLTFFKSLETTSPVKKWHV